MCKARLAMVGIGIAAAIVSAQRPAATNRYVDSALCATCHAEIANTFRKTGMGRSFYTLQTANAVEAFGKPFYHAASDSYLVMFERDGKYYQRRWQKGFDGREINVDEKQVDFVMGSGNHGRTYLHLSARNTLQQLPLGWYSEKGGYWAMAPGFDRPDYPGSTRVVTYECMFCHNAYPAIPKSHDEVGAKPEFELPIPTGIDCQRCHGPGERHVEAAGRPGAQPAEIRAAIVNPKRLSPDRELEVCMQCHLETTAVSLPHDIRRFDRAPFSYVPGQPLGDFRLTFDRAGGMGERFEVAHAAYRMRESQCFLKSEGKLRCTTCHDPHNIPRGEAAIAHYNGVCLKCHGAATKSLTTAAKPMPASGVHAAGANCISCHMPKRRTDDAVYMAMTDHFIRSRQPAGDLLAAKAETPESATPPYRGKVVPYYPANLAGTEASLYNALAQILEHSNMQEGLPLLENLLEQVRPQRGEYYADLAEGLSYVGQAAKAMPYFEAAVQHAPGSEIIARKLGSAQMEAGQLEKAEATLRRVVVMAPDDGGAWGMLGQVLWQRGRNAEAVAAFRKSISADPEVPEMHNSLGTLLLAGGDAAGAEKEFREAMRIQPSLPQAQMNLASLLASRGETDEARYHFERSILLKPNYAEARLNYARLLVSIGDAGSAEKQVQASVEADSSVAAAHELWGRLLGTKGDIDGAVRELQSAVRLQPDLWIAQYELGVALGKNRDYAGAAEHLKIAAQGADSQVKASAQGLLQRLGQ
jgi:predicted CXXCH cytochrome family protein